MTGLEEPADYMAKQDTQSPVSPPPPQTLKYHASLSLSHTAEVPISLQTHEEQYCRSITHQIGFKVRDSLLSTIKSTILDVIFICFQERPRLGGTKRTE